MSKLTLVISMEVDDDQYRHLGGENDIDKELIAENIADLLDESGVYEVISIKDTRGGKLY